MAYTPTVWANDSAPFINSTNLNKMETGIDEAHESENVAFLADGLGAVSRSVRAKLRDHVSVKDFGVIGDGVTSDVSTLTNAAASGFDLVFPSGTYLVDSSLTIASDCYFSEGAKFLVGDGATLTLSGQIIAGDKSVIFTWAGTGAISLTKMGHASVHWFGALGDGTTDDAAAVQKCADGLSTGIVQFYEGVYLLNAKISITGQRKEIRGIGIGVSLVVKGILDDDMFLFYSGATTTQLFHVGASHLTLQTASGSIHTAGAMLAVTSGNRVNIQNLFIFDPYVGIRITSCRNVRINNIDSAVSGVAAFQSTQQLVFTENTTGVRSNSNIFVSDYTARNASGVFLGNTGILIQQADGIWFDNCYIGNSKVNNVDITPVNADSQITGVRFSNCWIDPADVNGRGIHIRGGTTGTYGFLDFTNVRLGGGLTALDGIRINPSAGTTIKDVSISNCKIENYQARGIQVVSNGTVSVFGLQICNNICMQNSTDFVVPAIELAACENFVCSDNNCGYTVNGATGETSYGIGIGLLCDDYVITGNNLLGNVTGGISIASGTSYIISGNLTPETAAMTDVASAAAVTLPVTGNIFNITGTTGITSIVASRPGRAVTLKFADAVTVTDGGNLRLAGDFTSDANDALSLICDGTNWIETSRSAN